MLLPSLHREPQVLFLSSLSSLCQKLEKSAALCVALHNHSLFSLFLSCVVVEAHLATWVAESVRNILFIFKLFFLLSGLLILTVCFLFWNRQNPGSVVKEIKSNF